MNEVLITIIVPVYNTEPYLRRCLDSIINQTYSKIEIVIINDGSTDGSLEIIKEYAQKDTRIIYIDKANEGIGAAYVDALKIAKGDYISFVDSDDYIENNTYGLLTPYLGNIDIIQFGWQYFNEDNIFTSKIIFEPIILKGNKNIVKYQFEKLKKPNLIKVVNKKLFENIILLKQNIGIDHLITYQIISKAESMVMIKDILYNGFVRANSVSRSTFDFNRINQRTTLSFSIFDIFSDESNKYIYSHMIKEHLLFVLSVGKIYYQKHEKSTLSEFIYNKCEFDTFFAKYFKRMTPFDLKFIIKILLFQLNHNFYYKISNLKRINLLISLLKNKYATFNNNGKTKAGV